VGQTQLYLQTCVLHSKLDSTSCREVIFLQDTSQNSWTLTEKNISTQEREREGESDMSSARISDQTKQNKTANS